MDADANDADSNKIIIDGKTFFTYLLMAGVTLLVIILVWIYLYHVVKDRKAARKKAVAKVDVEGGRRPEMVDEEGIHELEQPAIPEADGQEVRELWDEGCAREMDGHEVVEIDGHEKAAEIDDTPGLE